MLNNKKYAIISLVMALVLGVTGCSKTKTTKDTIESPKAKIVKNSDVRLEDDYYEYVNKEWMDKTEIPKTASSIGATEEIEEKINKTLIEDFDKMASGEKEIENKEIGEFIKLYKLANDYEKRNNDGMKPLIPYLKEIESISNLKDFNEKLSYFSLNNYKIPFEIFVSEDGEKLDKKALYFNQSFRMLPDLSYYEKDNEEGEKLKKGYKEMIEKSLLKIGKTQEEASKMHANFVKFDEIMAKYALSDDEQNDKELSEKKIDFKDFIKLSKNVDLEKTIVDLIGGEPDYIIDFNTKFSHNLDKVINEENLPIIKDWLYTLKLISSFTYMTDDLTEIIKIAEELENGVTEIQEPKERAYNLASGFFSNTIGNYYGKNYFGKEAKENVTNMTKNIISVYKDRLEKNDWLSKETKAEALNKLNGINIQIGYPENGENEGFKIDSNKSLFENISRINNEIVKRTFDGFNKPVEKGGWIMPGQVVNAAYDSLSNTICFPAGILQAPFYSSENSLSRNYGSIGTTIAHEISHAFDSSGALYDKDGNLSNWWTDKDFKEFEKRTEKVKKLFDGIEYAGGKIDGELTLGENISDIGGLRVALEALKIEGDVNLEEFFSSWAESWRMKATKESEKNALLIDEHAPGKVRANIQLSNMEEFIEFYNIKEGDKMYLSPEKRVSIW